MDVNEISEIAQPAKLEPLLTILQAFKDLHLPNLSLCRTLILAKIKVHEAIKLDVIWMSFVSNFSHLKKPTNLFIEHSFLQHSAKLGKFLKSLIAK